MHTTRTEGTLLYRERIVAAWWMWVVALAVGVSAAFVLLVVVGPLPALLSGLAVLVLLGAGLARATAVIEVTTDPGDGVQPQQGQLRAGRARLPLSAAGRVRALDHEQAAYVRGPGIDARAFHLLRGWVPTAVVVEVRDPEDPTPYWYVSTRRPQRLARALEAARGR